MKREPIIIKQVMDKDGAFSHIELVQGGNVIELSIGNTSTDVQKATYKWNVLRGLIDKKAQELKEQVEKELRESYNWKHEIL